MSINNFPHTLPEEELSLWHDGVVFAPVRTSACQSEITAGEAACRAVIASESSQKCWSHCFCLYFSIIYVFRFYLAVLSLALCTLWLMLSHLSASFCEVGCENCVRRMLSRFKQNCLGCQTWASIRPERDTPCTCLNLADPTLKAVQKKANSKKSTAITSMWC